MGVDVPLRPLVVLTTTVSVDGRVTPTRSERLLDPDVDARWRAAWPADVVGLIEQRQRWIEEHHAPTVVLEGSGTFVAAESPSPWADALAHGRQLYVDFLPRLTPRWFVVVDGRGRIEWEFTGDDETALVVLVCRATPVGYLRRLRTPGVGYLVVGDERVDLARALTRIRTALDARAVIADGGGGLNGALLRSGLIDEVHVITFPALVGGLGTPTFLDGPPLPPGSHLVPLRPLSLVQGDMGSVLVRYEVQHPTGPPRS